MMENWYKRVISILRRIYKQNNGKVKTDKFLDLKYEVVNLATMAKKRNSYTFQWKYKILNWWFRAL